MVRRLTPMQLAADVAIAAAFLLAGLAIAAVRGWPWVAVLAGMAGALAVRRLSPVIALGIAWLVALAQVLTGLGPDPSNAAILVVLFATAAYGDQATRWAGLASAFAGAIVVGLWFAAQVSSSRNAVLTTAFMFAGSLGVFLLAWALGQLWRMWLNWRESRRAEAEAETRLAAEEERGRIARDMHDVVAHSLAVVVAQADGARYGRDPEAMARALETISGTAREALTDVRVLLAQLRHRGGDAPQPGLADLDRLIAQLRDAGLRVEFETAGDAAPLGAGGQLAAYRIVQESLTNALRHGDRSEPVRVRLTWGPHGLDLAVSSALKPGHRKPEPSGTAGHGIPGMTERAVAAGGRLDTRTEGRTFVVHAWLPFAEATA